MLFQFTSSARPQDAHDGHVAWNESFLVPSSSSQVKVVVTVTNKDENGMPVFRGQSVVDIQDNLLYFKRAEVAAPLGKMEWEPRELANRSLMRMHAMDATPAPGGVVSLEVIPCSNQSTHSGALEEASTAFSRN